MYAGIVFLEIINEKDFVRMVLILGEIYKLQDRVHNNRGICCLLLQKSDCKNSQILL